MNWKRIVFIGLIAFGAYQHFFQHVVTHSDGELVSTKPLQTSADNVPFKFYGYTITPLETFEIEARVLAREHYAFDRGADLSPVDLVLGWGPMSDSHMLSQIQISQSQRFYYWHVDAFPIPRRDIETHSANMHMIPASEQLEDQLKSVKVGQHVKISGYLVQANAPNGFHWKSSLSREDTGAGACELVFVKTLSLSNS
ncbi:MAG TPA: hypothetical protein DCO68_10090 [Methylophilaceae bacterium]|nr:hypothetical protein [Methylophilaceae bacterium]